MKKLSTALVVFSLLVSTIVSPSFAELGHGLDPSTEQNNYDWQIQPIITLSMLEKESDEPGDTCPGMADAILVVNANGKMVCVPKRTQPEIPMNSVEWFIQMMRLSKSKNLNN